MFFLFKKSSKSKKKHHHHLLTSTKEKNTDYIFSNNINTLVNFYAHIYSNNLSMHVSTDCLSVNILTVN